MAVMNKHDLILLQDKHWAIMDIEYIQTASTHRCVRKLYILEKNGHTDLDLDIYPCIRYKDLEKKYQRLFHFYRRNTHKLRYSPRRFSPECSQVIEKLNDFVVNNNIELILHKGGAIEKELAEKLQIPSFNIILFDDIERPNSHKPRLEVEFYYEQIIQVC